MLPKNLLSQLNVKSRNKQMQLPEIFNMSSYKFTYHKLLGNVYNKIGFVFISCIKKNKWQLKANLCNVKDIF